MFCYFRTLALLALITAPVSAAETSWTQFRGQDRNGISPETGLLHAFPESGPEELWRRPLGAAFSGIVASGDALYTTESDEQGDYAVKLDAATGKTLWRRKIAPRYAESFGNGPRATPALDGEHLYVLSGDGHVAALKAGDGEVVWSRSLMEDYGLELPAWGFASAPLVVGDQLILSVGAGEGRGVVAFDKANGEVRWSGGEGEAAYGSPVVIRAAGRRQLVVLDKPGVLGLSLEGKELWRHEWASERGIKPALPIFVEPDLLMVSASYGVGAVGLRLSAAGESVRAEPVWENKVMRNHFNSSVLLDGMVYGFDNSTLKCVDPKVGETKWATRGGLGKGSLIYADGMLVVLTETGTLKLAEARPDTYVELASHKVFDGRCWTEPTLAAGRLYLRNQEEVVALDLRGSDTAEASAAATVAPVDAPGEKLSLAQILERHVAALGGRERLDSLKSLRLKGVLEQNGAVSPFTLLRKAPNFYRLESTFFGQSSLSISDGETAWQTDPRSGQLVALAEEQLALVLEERGGLLGPLAQSRTEPYKPELVGNAMVDGVDTYQVRVHLKGGRTQDFFLAQDTFLVLKKTFPAFMGWMGNYTAETFFLNYAKHAGLAWPGLMERQDDTFTSTFRIESVEVGAELPDSLFQTPK